MRRKSVRCAEERTRGSRGLGALFFIGTFGMIGAVIGAMLDPTHRFNGFLFGGLAGLAIGVALRAWPTNSDYPQDYIDKSLD